MDSATLDTTAPIAPITDGEATESWLVEATYRTGSSRSTFFHYHEAVEHFQSVFEAGGPGLHVKLSRQITTVETVAEATV